MGAFFNEWDRGAAAWLRELIREGHLPEGVVDERSVADIAPADVGSVSHFFAGIGGWPYALRLAGWPDDRPVWTASLPCQPFSVAGKRRGTDDERHLAPVFLDLVRECRPAIVFGEQVASKDGRDWLADLRAEMEGMGYAVGAADLCAASVGAKHVRQRIFWGAVAHTERDEQRGEEPRCGAPGRVGRIEQSIPWNTPWRCALSSFRALADGLPRCVGGTDGARNAIVPALAAEFVTAFMEALE